ncbi:hypothetical protein KQX54_014172 [Cotesia glomerata]|uniref:Venom protein n=1 Tax=Cotesia glomerata TaxID=32391 RepID=A0AAV7I4X0_COTGL|nr:hypothetical protein KQX54_014172 [Cotesia glomerata]
MCEMFKRDNKRCICRANNIQVKKKCVHLYWTAFVGRTKSKSAAINSACIDNKCTCNASYRKNSRGECLLSKCTRSELLKRYVVFKTKFATCSINKICSCSYNTIEINGIQCSPVLNGFCWQDDECFPSLFRNVLITGVRNANLILLLNLI